MNAPMSDRRACPRGARGPTPRSAAFSAGLLASSCALASSQPVAPSGMTPAVALGWSAAAAALVLLVVILAQHRALRSAREGLRRRDDELAHAARLAAAGELSASIAHEISQPLGAILSNADAAEMLLARPHVPIGEVRQILADIRADDLRAHEVIRRLRALLERHETERRPLELQPAVADALGLVADEAKRRRTPLVFRHGATRATVLGDRVQLQQVMLNLLLNALDASAGVPVATREILVETGDDADEVVLSVCDRGAGFGPHPAEELFGSFFSTKAGGLGLGLSIARSIVEAHQGTIAAAPRPGGGAVFTVRLPVLATPVPARTRPSAQATPTRTAAPA
jgi:C4-dicarboxylate-specific signal transduction histidine kinase